LADSAIAGALRKMRTTLATPVQYTMILGEEELPMNEHLGRRLRLQYRGVINCINCNRKTNKSFNQGYCYPCFSTLAQCDSCIVSPEKCHYAAGTCREPQWGEEHCMKEHFVYLANTSGIKVGITRGTQVPTRWMDQGATQARAVFRVSSRLHSGLVESILKAHIPDKTHWQAMLKGDAEPCNLEEARRKLMAACAPELDALTRQHGIGAVTELLDSPEVSIQYPVLEFPAKVSAFNLDKTPNVEGTLLGIKGQYLIFDAGVINMRKYGGYQLSLQVAG
jgi:Protein of unknown function (DUF2797)